MKANRTKKETSASGKNIATLSQNKAHSENSTETDSSKKDDAYLHTNNCRPAPSLISPPLSEENSFRLRNAHKNAILQLDKCHQVLTDLAALRLYCKLSNTRVTGVVRELNELRKVMSVYSQILPSL